MTVLMFKKMTKKTPKKVMSSRKSRNMKRMKSQMVMKKERKNMNK